MKYARLSPSDLKDFEKEFIEFLVINGITADEWESIKASSSEKTEAIIEQFSDVVWESTLRKHTFIEKRTPSLLTLCKVDIGVCTTLWVSSSDDFYDFTETKYLTEEKLISKNIQVKIQEDLLTIAAPEYLFQCLKSGFFLTKSDNYSKFFEFHKK